MQVYRRLTIGTAKLTEAERRGIPHHLIDLVDPDQPFTAADYGRLARQALWEIQGRRRTPLVVGGAGLYLRALRGEIFPGPGEVQSIRSRLREEVRSRGSETLHARLKTLDPSAATRIHPHDAFRIIRALEILEITGRPVSELWEVHRKQISRLTGLVFGLRREGTELYPRINERVDWMLEGGLIQEVKDLLQEGYPADIKPFLSHNYRHIVAHLLGRVGLEEAVRRTKRDTRHYAKRQMTWFRREEGIQWVPISDAVSGQVLKELADQIQQARDAAWKSLG
jgi:tRNA dimethylallyltransferase